MKKKSPPRWIYSQDLAKQALHVCRLLKAAYDRGEENGGKIEWEELDAAHEQAIKALKMAKEI